MRVVVARSTWARLRGLLGTAPDNTLLLLVPCCDIHTFGMTYPIDVAFMDCKGRVVLSQRNVGPARRARSPAAYAALERAASPEKPWYQPGDYVEQYLTNLMRGRNRL